MGLKYQKYNNVYVQLKGKYNIKHITYPTTQNGNKISKSIMSTAEMEL